MESLIDRISNSPYDITYIAIGSAFISNVDTPENRQQFPPFIESQYRNNKKIRIINIDPTFENPYFIKRYLPELIEENNRYYCENLEALYISTTLELSDDTIVLFDTINKIIMNQNNILIVADFTGRDFTFIEKYFYESYKNTLYEAKFNSLICYDFIVNYENTCRLNLLINYPIIQNNTIIKFNFIDESDFLIKIKNKNLNHIHRQIIVVKFNNFINNNFYVYRNLIGKNITENIINYIPKSIFNHINIEDYSPEDLYQTLIHKLFIYNEIIHKLFNINNYLDDAITQLKIIDQYKSYNNFIMLNKHLYNFIKN